MTWFDKSQVEFRSEGYRGRGSAWQDRQASLRDRPEGSRMLHN